MLVSDLEDFLRNYDAGQTDYLHGIEEEAHGSSGTSVCREGPTFESKAMCLGRFLFPSPLENYTPCSAN